MLRPYTKPFLTLDQQVRLLQSRGLEISDVALAKEHLHRIGYYRLTGYLYPFRRSTLALDNDNKPYAVVHDDYRQGSSFEQAVALYVFDKKLRGLLTDVLERIEIALRTDFALRLGAFDPWAHRDPARFDPAFSNKPVNPADPHGTTRHDEFVTKLDKSELKGKEEFVQHFRQTYSDKVPIWVAVELLDFGSLSMLISGLKRKDAEDIAKRWGMPRYRHFFSWVRCFAFLRNVCAHHARLWNRNLIAQPAEPKLGEVPDLDHLRGDRLAQERLYSGLAGIRHFQRIVNPNSTWGDRLKAHVETFPGGPGIAIGQAGFPAGWEALPLWR